MFDQSSFYDEQESPGAGTSAPVVEQTEKSSDPDKKRKMKIQILSKIKTKFFLKPQKDPADGIPDTQSEIPVVLDFTQNLQQHHLAEADRQLLEQEVNLFISESDEPCAYSENDEDKLHTNYESLMLQLWLAIEDSFNKENQETLRSAMTAILQEEQRDRHWMELDEEQRPRWRPLRCRQIHDTLLKKVVELRLRQAGEDESGANDLSTSLNTEVCRMGKQIQRDLLIVVKDIQGCYSPEFNVCNMYAELYHQAFSTKLMELTRSNINLEECAYILSWINTYYLGVLEGSWEYAQPVHMCFVDLEKAFDRVPRGILWGVLQEYGIGGPLLRAVRSLYDRSRSLVRMAGRSQGAAKGRRESCLEATGSLLFADDVVLLAASGQDLQHALGRFAAECEAAGMRISTSKSVAMVLDQKRVACSLQQKVDLHGETVRELEHVTMDHSEQVTELQTAVKKLTAQTKCLKQKCEDLEACLRRNNLRIVGIPEGSER
ncbi:uncharacterized protein LOC143523664 [Brachyhypopomus gauderio]|uniref:uncharacterized protein LOC143523664 n=1 Tax=Brachyhypopomus gauderio TaxID=698409 RepID=UPI004040FA82